jgi:AmmeMemoRadiSam system protein B
MRRNPAVAGQFYSAGADQLRKDLSSFIHLSTPKIKAYGIIAPHAGYVYSGATAGKVFGLVEIPSTVLIIGPNHRGRGEPAALYPDGEWLTPLGAVHINSRLNALIKQQTPFVQFDTLAHEHEHSLEVQVPFLQYLRPDVSISALCLGHGDFRSLHEIGVGIANAIRAYGDDVLIVASSDMTHYESAASAKEKDGKALEQILALNPEILLRVCSSNNITMCGVMPSAVMMVAAQQLGATKAEQVAYSTSGDVTGDNSQVVAYLSVVIT